MPLAGSELLFDRSPPPLRPMQLHIRQDDTTTSLSSSIPASTTTGDGSTTSSASTSSTATPTSDTSLPSPFDSSLGNNFTSPSCPAFFTSFLTNSTFQKCVPLSLLLQTSNGFFAAERSLVRLTQTLDATCNVDFATCSSVMASLATQIELSSNCGEDLQMGNPTVTQAFNGFVAYDPLYRAGCLTDSAGGYCFADAVTNTSAPTSSYIYYLPLGVQLPAGTQPACNQCLQNTMAIFAAAASNNSVPLSADYTDAASVVDDICGSTFAQASIEVKNGASSTASSTGLGLMSLFMVLVWVFA